MAWIKSHSETAGSRELFVLREAMGWTRMESLGFIDLFRHAVLKHAPNGDVTDISPGLLAEWTELKPVAAKKAIAVMRGNACGMLVRRGGRLLVAGWLDDVGEYLRGSLWKNPLHHPKWKEACEMHGRLKNQPISDVVPGRSRDCPATDKIREEEIRGEVTPSRDNHNIKALERFSGRAVSGLVDEDEPTSKAA